MAFSLLAQATETAALTFKLTWLDGAILLGAIIFNLSVGAFFARRQTGTGSYFLGSGKMPGWLVGFSITASMISAMTFLAIPGFTFKENWAWVLPSFSFLILGFLSAFFIVSFFRKVKTPSGYAFLEQRYGTWARVYAAFLFICFNLMRLGVVLYVTSIALDEFLPVGSFLTNLQNELGSPFPWPFNESIVWLILLLGLVATIYTMCGGFEAVVWTDFFQSMLFIFGGATLLPIILYHIAQSVDVSFLGALAEIFDRASAAGKLSIGHTELTFSEVDGSKTLWVFLISTLFVDANNYTTRQDLIQRYRAPKDLFNARVAVIIGACTVVPIWIYFNFLGTSLWAFYDINPSETVEAFRNSAPEKVVPYFMATYLPAGLKGFFLAAILTASLSTMAPMLNACTVTWIDDFYHRFLVKGRTDMHYMRAGRVSTLAIGLFMIGSAVLIFALRTQTIQNFHATFAMVFSIGLFGLFMVGFFTKRVGNRAAGLATAIVFPLGILWAILYSIDPSSVPDILWLTVFLNLLLVVLAFGCSLIFPQEKKDLKNLTLYTLEKE